MAETVIKMGGRCQSCGTGYDACTALILNSGKSCCGRCYSTDTHQESIVKMDPDKEKVLDLVRPRPRLYYPTPWRVGDTNAQGHVTVVCAEGHWVCEAPSLDAADAIVMAVNEFARRDWADG